MNHWNLFKAAWRIFWRNPALWLFGFLAALGGGFNLRYSFNFDFNPRLNFDPNLFGRGFTPNGQPLPELPFEFRTLLNQLMNSNTLATIVVIGIVWTIIAFLLTTYADGALIGMVNAIGSEQKINLGFGFRAGAKRFLQLLAVRFTLALPALLLAIIAGIVASQLVLTTPDNTNPQQFFNRTVGAVAGLGTLSFIVALLMAAIGVSAERAVVIDELPIWPAIAKGWKFLWSKFGDYFTIVLLFIGLGIAAALVFACILVPILCGTIGLGAVSSFNSFRQDGANVFASVITLLGPSLLITVLLGLLFGILVNVFTSSVWTLAYREWQGLDEAGAAPPATGLQTVEPIAPIEPLGPINPSSNEPPAGGNA